VVCSKDKKGFCDAVLCSLLINYPPLVAAFFLLRKKSKPRMNKAGKVLGGFATIAAPGKTRVIGVRLIRSGAHQRPELRATLRALGLTKMQRTVYHKNIQPIRGMLLKVKHLIDIHPVPEPPELM
jgi:large subunit ribosomal protein L30